MYVCFFVLTVLYRCINFQCDMVWKKLHKSRNLCGKRVQNLWLNPEKTHVILALCNRIGFGLCISPIYCGKKVMVIYVNNRGNWTSEIHSILAEFGRIAVNAVSWSRGFENIPFCCRACRCCSVRWLVGRIIFWEYGGNLRRISVFAEFWITST